MTLLGYPAQGWCSVRPAPVPVQSLFMQPVFSQPVFKPFAGGGSRLAQCFFHGRLILGEQTVGKNGIYTTAVT